MWYKQQVSFLSPAFLLRILFLWWYVKNQGDLSHWFIFSQVKVLSCTGGCVAHLAPGNYFIEMHKLFSHSSSIGISTNKQWLKLSQIINNHSYFLRAYGMPGFVVCGQHLISYPEQPSELALLLSPLLYGWGNWSLKRL